MFLKKHFSYLVLGMIVISGVLLSIPHQTKAQVDPNAHLALAAIYARRSDLQSLFRASDWKAVPSIKTIGLTNLEAWASEYGYKEHIELASFNPKKISTGASARIKPNVLADTADHAFPSALALVPNTPKATQSIPGTFNFSTITAEKVLVIDPTSRQIILSKDADVQHPLASLTKLMTAILVTEKGLSMDQTETVLADDEVGGARLRVSNGTPLTVRDIFYAMIVGSANNAAHALARLTGKPIPDFVAEMNTRAKTLGLTSTTFSDTCGLDLGNVSTAKDIAALALTAFNNPTIQRAAQTAYYPLVAEGQTRRMKNTNALLTNSTNGLYVFGGKTGYLVESKWNLAVKMQDDRNHPLLIVTLGSASEPDVFKDSERIGRWVWDHYSWGK